MTDDNHHDSGSVQFRRGGKLSAKRTLTVSNSFPTMKKLLIITLGWDLILQERNIVNN